MVTATTLIFISANLVPQRTPASPIKDFLEGLAFVRFRSIVLIIIAMDFTANVAGNFQILLPILAEKFDVGAVGYGLLSSAPAVGSFFAATILLSLGDFRYKGYLIAGSLLAYGACLVLLGLAPWFGLALVAAAGLGLSDALQQITRNTTIQMLTPDPLRGRVTSFQHLLVNGGPSIGQGVLGGLAGALGAPIALVIGGIICAGGNLAILAWRRDLRDANLGVPPDELRARPVLTGGGAATARPEPVTAS
jgi:MFS family permease